MNDLSVLIMAAGKGSRMLSDRAKVLHPVCGAPMLHLVYDAAATLEPREILIVIGQDADLVRASLQGRPAQFVLQAQQLGTGHAVMAARQALEGKTGDLIVLHGDTPRVKPATLRGLAERHRASGAATTLLTSRPDCPFGYGRILRRADGSVIQIVEERDATPEQRAIPEINPAFYCFRIGPLLTALESLSNRNAQGEYYLTDIIAIQANASLNIQAVEHGNFEELLGINTRAELAEASRALRLRKSHELMDGGVTLIDPERTYVELGVAVARDVTIHPMVTLQGRTTIAEGSIVHSGSRIADSRIGSGVEVRDGSIITDSEIGDGSTVGPFARLRDQSRIGNRCRVGNFVELKKAVLGDGTKAAHHAYLGDAEIGQEVNIGAGVITCNYDGVRKHVTIIRDGAFIGSDSQLVAPLCIGEGAYVAAGSCITKDVPAGALAIARGRQVNKLDWARRRKQTGGPG